MYEKFHTSLISRHNELHQTNDDKRWSWEEVVLTLTSDLFGKRSIDDEIAEGFIYQYCPL